MLIAKYRGSFAFINRFAQKLRTVLNDLTGKLA